jgi:hypothetical protein
VDVRVLTTADAAEWEAALPAAASVFGSLGFARVQEETGAGEARLLVAEAGGARLAYPLLLRPLEPLGLGVPAGARCDAASPPFTGPLVSGTLDPGAERELAEAIADALSAAGVVAEFAHLHPWRARPALSGGAEPDREIVWVDVTLDPERLLSESYTHACRKNVRRAEREGVVVREAADDADVEAFHRIYTATMERNRAAPAYFFGLDYFLAIRRELGERARFALAERRGEVLAATLYLHDDEDVYSYLGGADHAHQRLRPTNAVVHESIAWARERGKRRLVLGGGYRPGDGIFRFKASFSPLRATLQLSRRVHLPSAYEELVTAWRARHGAEPGGYFPAYRAAPPAQDVAPQAEGGSGGARR